MELEKNDPNLERFSGFANIYDLYRPIPPTTVVDILLNYLKKDPNLVVDLGCGTGLSTFVWQDRAKKVIGIEPNLDMLNQAKKKLEGKEEQLRHIFFEQGVSNQTNLATNSVDIVTCSQSFHWMEPSSTLKEVARVLVDGGIFAAYDNDWPPSVDWVVENEYEKLLNKVYDILDNQSNDKEKVRKWDKEGHLKNIQDSELFRYSKEVVFHNVEKSDADRFIGLALSQGALQSILKKGMKDLDGDIENFKKIVNERFNGEVLDIIVSYRMRLGIK